MIAKDPALDRRIWMLAWPLLLSNITAPLLGLVDTAVVGHLDSPVYLAAVALGLAGSWYADTPVGPSIVVAAAVLFGFTLLRRPDS